MQLTRKPKQNGETQAHEGTCGNRHGGKQQASKKSNKRARSTSPMAARSSMSMTMPISHLFTCVSYSPLLNLSLKVNSFDWDFLTTRHARSSCSSSSSAGSKVRCAHTHRMKKGDTKYFSNLHLRISTFESPSSNLHLRISTFESPPSTSSCPNNRDGRKREPTGL